MSKVHRVVIGASLSGCLFFMADGWGFLAFGFDKTIAIGTAYVTHLSLHEIGHQIVAEEVGADSPRIHFFKKKNGNFYPGLSTYQGIPEESKLPYAWGGEWMAGFTFEYALQSYHHRPNTYNKALMVFSGMDFLMYTLLSNYVHPENDLYDTSLIREETGLSKEALLFLVMAKSLMNTYRVFNEDATFIPMIAVGKTNAALMVCFRF